MKKFWSQVQAALIATAAVIVIGFMFMAHYRRNVEKARVQAADEQRRKQLKESEEAYNARVREIKATLDTADADAIIAEFVRRFGS